VSGPPAKAVEAALETMAEELHRLYPHLEVRVLRPGQKLPAGAIELAAVPEADAEPVGDRSARNRVG
jgi:nitrate/nitrite-specific signal transduction histidine kinase